MILASMILVVLAPPPDPGPSELDVEACMQDDSACVKVAGAHFDAGRFGDAVRLFEALALAYPWTPKYHYFAGLAREGAGDDTEAYIHMRHFLASDADNTTERRRAERRVATILVRTTRVSVHIPPHTTPVTLGLKRLDEARADEPKIIVPLDILPASGDHHELALAPGEWELSIDPPRLGDREFHPQRLAARDGVRTLKLEFVTTPVRHELTLDLGPTRALDHGITLELSRPGGPAFTLTPKTPTLRRELPPGTWTYQARARGFIPKTNTIVLDGPTQQPVQLTPKWTPERRKRLGLGLGLTAAGLATGITGAVLLASVDHYLEHYTIEKNVVDQRVIYADLTDASGGLLGATLGMFIGAASSVSRSRRLRLAETVTGAGGLVAGVGWYWYRAARFEHYPNENPSSLRDLEPETIVAAGMMGFGASLLTSSFINLISHRTKRPHRADRQTRLRIAPNPTGARLRLDF